MTKTELLVVPLMVLIFSSIVIARFGTAPLSVIQAYIPNPFGGHRCSPELEARQRKAANLSNETTVQAKSVPVLVYHGIALESPRSDDILFCYFKDHMVTLKEAGYQTVSLQDFYLFTQGKKSLPDRSFLLTFDDGQRSSYYLSDSTLEKLNYTAVMFIITEHSLGEGSSYYLSIEEVRDMLKTSRWEVQSHGQGSHGYIVIDSQGRTGHYLSNKLWLPLENRLETDEEYKARIRRDFVESKAGIEEKLGVDVIAFAFPFGDFGQGSLNLPDAGSYIQEELGSVYDLGTFYQVYPSRGYRFNYPDSSSFMIKRISFNTSEDGAALLANLEEGRSKALPFVDRFAKNEGWITIWGELNIDQGMQVRASEKAHGSAVFLDGSFLWTDYLFSAHVQSIVGSNVGLIARYVDKSNFVMCIFRDNSVRIDQRLGNETETIAEQELETPLDKTETEIDVGVKVAGNHASCLIDDTVVVEAPLSPVLAAGGIGLRSFDRDVNSPQITIDSVSVEPVRDN